MDYRTPACLIELRESALLTATTTGNDGAATEHAEEPQLAELLNQEAGLTSVIELKVVHNQAIEYYYKIEGTQLSSQKVQAVLQSKIPDQYCLGVAKLQKKTKPSSGKSRTAGRQVPRGSSEPSSSSTRSLRLFHALCRITIDLRKAKVQALLHNTTSPQTAAPTVTIAEVLHLKQMQRFDLMAIAA